MIGLPIVFARVASGVWSNVVEFSRSLGTLPVRPDPEFPAGAQRIWEVGDQSCAEVAEMGDYLHTVKLKEAALEATDGDIVIVRRVVDGSAEYTARRLSIRDGRLYLSHSKAQAAVEMGDDESLMDLVIAKWSRIGINRMTN